MTNIRRVILASLNPDIKLDRPHAVFDLEKKDRLRPFHSESKSLFRYHITSNRGSRVNTSGGTAAWGYLWQSPRPLRLSTALTARKSPWGRECYLGKEGGLISSGELNMGYF